MRPVLILRRHPEVSDVYVAFSITSQYKNKSEKIRQKYMKLKDWQAAGLSKVSYVDMNARVNIPKSCICERKGKLTQRDIRRLTERIS